MNEHERQRTAAAIAKVTRLAEAGVIPLAWVEPLQSELAVEKSLAFLLEGARHRQLVAQTLAVPEPAAVAS